MVTFMVFPHNQCHFAGGHLVLSAAAAVRKPGRCFGLVWVFLGVFVSFLKPFTVCFCTCAHAVTLNNCSMGGGSPQSVILWGCWGWGRMGGTPSPAQTGDDRTLLTPNNSPGHLRHRFAPHHGTARLPGGHGDSCGCAGRSRGTQPPGLRLPTPP